MGVAGGGQKLQKFFFFKISYFFIEKVAIRCFLTEMTKTNPISPFLPDLLVDLSLT